LDKGRIDLQGNEQLVSLLDVFKNAQNYRQLAGEMKAQDLSILRFLLAILTTVYSRVDARWRTI
jgi:CRISPR system Cascade subunit CasA